MHEWTWADQCFYGTPKSVRRYEYETSASVWNAVYDKRGRRKNKPETRYFWEINDIPAREDVARAAAPIAHRRALTLARIDAIDPVRRFIEQEENRRY